MVATPSLYPGSKLTLPLGLWLFMSRHIVEATRAYVAAGGVRSLKQGVLLGDISWAFGRNGFCSGSLGSGCAAFLSFRDIFTTSTQERGHPRLVSINSQGQHSCSSAWADQKDNCVLEGE